MNFYNIITVSAISHYKEIIDNQATNMPINKRICLHLLVAEGLFVNTLAY